MSETYKIKIEVKTNNQSEYKSTARKHEINYKAT